MVRSMTGFGAGSAEGEGWQAEVTVRTLNHRYLSVRVRSLHDQPELQVRVEGAAKRAFGRGEVQVAVELTRSPSDLPETLFDPQVVSGYHRALQRLTRDLSLPAPTLSDLIGIGAFQAAAPVEEDPWPVIEEALGQALAAAGAAREEEGRKLKGEIEGILRQIAACLDQIRARIPQVGQELLVRLRERIAELAVELDPQRLETEVALAAERADVREEVARLDVHLERAWDLLAREEPIGRELDFLSQELLREVNTLGAKSRDLEIASLVIDMKMGINSFKEQVQNVE